ncbi:MAG: rhodanese-like domain-containing protein [Owenweeksia sp.]|nr:rhodanese-like domain-containing protein [Owenweeksia sp.]
MNGLNEIIRNPETRLIDVRTPAEVNEIGVDRAENIPMDQVPQRLDEFKEMKGDIVLFCRSGARSDRVMQFLKQNGMNNVHNAGGYSDVKMHLM